MATYTKLAGGTVAAQRAVIGMEVGGAGATVWEPNGDGSEPAVNFLNGRIQAVAGGSNEMMRNAIAERVLGLPREPSVDSNQPFREVPRGESKWSEPSS
jgi:alkylation response protein AidB-like acyl-CoA dehydrogenase